MLSRLGAFVTKSTTSKKLVAGSLWVMAGTGAIQALRLVSTLTLSRLLNPEAFGLMALVGSVLTAVILFSEVGLQGAVIHDNRGDEPDFLNVVWTMQAVRGFGIAAVVCALSWPAAVFYGEESLVTLIPVCATSAIIAGLCSTSVLSLTRHLQPAKIILSQVAAKFLSLLAMIAVAWYFRSVWALVVGWLLEQFILLVWSHFWLIPGRRDRWNYDRDVARSLFRYGLWTWLSTIAHWILDQGDRIFLGRLLTAEELGVYSIATIIPSASIMIIDRLAQRIIQPFYAQVIRDEPSQLRKKIFKLRFGLSLVALPILWVLVFFGGTVVELLYDSRYVEAGWMVRLLALGGVATNTIGGAERVFMAEGDSYRHMVVKFVGAVLFVLAFLVGAWFGGIHALVISIVASRFLAYVPLAQALHKRGVWLPKLDLTAFAASLAITVLAHLYDPFF